MSSPSRYKYGYNDLRIFDMVKKTIVLCSGGLDSVGLVWKLLHETDEEVLVQHMRIKCYWDHWEYEEQAFLRCMDYIKKYSRPFTILPIMEYESTGIAPYRSLGAICGIVGAIRNDADRTTRGTVSVDTGTTYAYPPNKYINTAMFGIIDILTKDTNIIQERPVKDLDKRDWFKILPKELTDMVAVCWTPLWIDGKWTDCNECDSCLRDIEGRSGVDPIHGDEWVQKYKLFERPQELRNMHKSHTVLFGLSLQSENISYLWHLLTETTLNVVIQPIEIIEPSYKNPNTTKIIEYLKENARKFLLLPTMHLDLAGPLDIRTRELAKIFCIGNATKVYKTYISNAVVTFPKDKQLIQECKSMFNFCNFNNFTPIDTKDSQCILPDNLKELLNC